MVRVTLETDGYKYKLNRQEVRMFREELLRVTRGRATKGLMEEVAPDCSIHIKYPGRREKVYEIYGQVVLHDPNTNKSWQFYLGYLLLDLLYSSPL